MCVLLAFTCYLIVKHIIIFLNCSQLFQLYPDNKQSTSNPQTIMMQSIVNVLGLGRSNSSSTIGVSTASVSSSSSFVSSNPNPTNTSSSHQSSTLDKSSEVTTFTTIKPPTAGNVLASFLEERSVHFGPNTLDYIPWIPRPFRYWNTQECQDAIKRDDQEDDSIRFSKEKMRNKVLKAMVSCGMKDQQRFIKDTAQIKAKLTEIKNGTHIIKMGSLEWALLKSKLVATRDEYKSLPPHLQAMFHACYTFEDLEAFEMACEAQCDEWKIVEVL